MLSSQIENISDSEIQFDFPLEPNDSSSTTERRRGRWTTCQSWQRCLYSTLTRLYFEPNKLIYSDEFCCFDWSWKFQMILFASQASIVLVTLCHGGKWTERWLSVRSFLWKITIDTISFSHIQTNFVVLIVVHGNLKCWRHK